MNAPPAPRVVPPPGTGTLRRMVGWAAAELGSRAEARWLVADVLQVPDRALDTMLDGAAPATLWPRLAELVGRRVSGEPLQYVLGHWAFRTLELTVDRRVLIPRPETEQVVEVALATLVDVAGTGAPEAAVDRPVTVVDVGTGSGAIALSIAAEAPARLGPGRAVRVWGTDLSAAALDVAAGNARCLAGVTALAVGWAEGPWLRALPPELVGQVDLVVSNPPYIAEGEWVDLEAEVRDFEPRLALVAGPSGMESFDALFAEVPGWLAPGGAVVVEVGPAQAAAVGQLARTAGASSVDVHLDLAGRSRTVAARFGP